MYALLMIILCYGRGQGTGKDAFSCKDFMIHQCPNLCGDRYKSAKSVFGNINLEKTPFWGIG